MHGEVIPIAGELDYKYHTLKSYIFYFIKIFRSFNIFIYKINNTTFVCVYTFKLGEVLW